MEWFDNMCTQQIQSMQQMKMMEAMIQPACPPGTSPAIVAQLKQLQVKAVDLYLAAMLVRPRPERKSLGRSTCFTFCRNEHDDEARGRPP